MTLAWSHCVIGSCRTIRSGGSSSGGVGERRRMSSDITQRHTRLVRLSHALDRQSRPFLRGAWFGRACLNRSGLGVGSFSPVIHLGIRGKGVWCAGTEYFGATWHCMAHLYREHKQGAYIIGIRLGYIYLRDARRNLGSASEFTRIDGHLTLRLYLSLTRWPRSLSGLSSYLHTYIDVSFSA